MTVEQFRLELLEETEAGRIEARVIPYGVPISHGGSKIQFDSGSVLSDSSRVVPLTVDHGGGATSRIGKLIGLDDRDDGLYAELSISDTQLGQEIRTLLSDGVLTDVSAGVEIDRSKESENDNGVLLRAGTLDHVSIVGTGAFAEAGSKVLAVHSSKGAEEMAEATTKEAAPLEEKPSEIEVLTEKLDGFEKTIAKLSVPGAIQEAKPAFTDKKDFVLTLAAATRGDSKAARRIEEYVLADDTTTTSAGVVPDGQSNDVISIIAENRPFVETLPRADIGSVGMSINFPTVDTKPSVDNQATEKTEVDSTAMAITTTPLDLITFAGASDVSRQLIERSQPSFVDILFREYGGVYADRTELSAVSQGVTGAGDTAILADLGADAALTYAAFAAASGAIMTGTRRAASDAILATDRWIQLLSLVDSDGRPLLVLDPQGPSNAAGLADLTSMSGTYAGIRIWADPAAPTGTCLIYNRSRSAEVGEQAPVQLRAEVVSLLGFEMGVYGLFGTIVKYPDGLYTLTLA